MATRSPVRPRPVAPHLQIYRWGPHMTVSIIHRATGVAMATLGATIFTWWLASLAAGPDAYATFLDVFTTSSGALNLIGWPFAVGFSLVFFLHMSNGIRHLVMDTGANYELKSNKRSSMIVLVGAPVLTLVYWIYMVVAR